MPAKIVTKPKQKINSQIRINRTTAIEKILENGRLKYKLLDDNEILKIYIGRGAELDVADSLQLPYENQKISTNNQKNPPKQNIQNLRQN